MVCLTTKGEGMIDPNDKETDYGDAFQRECEDDESEMDGLGIYD